MMRGDPLAALVLVLLAGAGCATVPGRSGGPEVPALYELFPADRSSPVLSAETDVTLSMGGRSVALQGVIALAGPDSFRIDLLDPLDRPTVVVFPDGERIVQYRPAAAFASSLRPIPPSCRDLSPAAWVPYVTGEGPPQALRESFRESNWLGGGRLVRHEGGEIAEEILVRRRGERPVPGKVRWYCGGEAAMSLEMDGFEEGGGPPGSIRVRFPVIGLAMEMTLDNPRADDEIPGEIFRPRLDPGTRWAEWALDVEGE